MLERNIYLVRHGETILNKQKIRQGSEGSLSPLGRSQAYNVGLRLKIFNIKKVFCSPFQRTIETFEEINKTLNLDVEFTELLAERRNPSQIIGRSYDDPLTVEAISFIDKSVHEPNARWADEENFEDLKNRALKLRDFLARNSVNGTLCVTHGIFLKMFLAVIKHGEDLTVSQYIKLAVLNNADNAGVSIIKYKPLNFFDNPWEIVAFNDTERSESN